MFYKCNKCGKTYEEFDHATYDHRCKECSKKTRWFLNAFYIGIALLFLGGFALATTISDGKVQITNSKMNETGMYYSDTRAFVRTADVVVCRGTSALDDLYKQFTCDVVCKSTDSDCGSEIWYGINSTVVNGGNIVFMKGVYPYSATVGADYLTWDNTKDVIIYGYGAILNATFLTTDTGKTALRFQSNVNNLNIYGLSVTSNGNCTSACQGIQIENATNVKLQDVNVYGIKGFQIVINARNYADNIVLDNVYAYGSGLNDVIGGGTITKSANVRNVKIINSKVIQQAGSYDNSIDIVGLNYSLISNNFVIGDILFGSETKGTENSIISNNIIMPINSTLTAGISSDNETSKDNLYTGNQIINGGIDILDSYSVISNNKMTLTSTKSYGISIGATSFNNQVLGNVLNNKGTLTNFIYVTNGANNISLIGNKIYGTYLAISNGNGNSNYVDNFQYGGSVTNYLCGATINPFNEKIWHNSTASCTCTGGSWKCWGMS